MIPHRPKSLKGVVFPGSSWQLCFDINNPEFDAEEIFNRFKKYNTQYRLDYIRPNRDWFDFQINHLEEWLTHRTMCGNPEKLTDQLLIIWHEADLIKLVEPLQPNVRHMLYYKYTKL